MKLPNALAILKDEVGPRWDGIPSDVKDDMLATLRKGEQLVLKDLKGEDTESEWLHVKAQTIAWISGSKAGLEALWWKALKKYAEALGEALVNGVVTAAKGMLK